MNHRRPSLLRVLLLLMVAIGPLQAQTVYACSMMDTVVHIDCCCEDHHSTKACTDSECDPTPASETPCCEHSVEIGVDEDVAAEVTTFKPVELRFGADSPLGLLPSLEPLFLLDPDPVTGIFKRLQATADSGSDTWLVTERLRI